GRRAWSLPRSRSELGKTCKVMPTPSPRRKWSWPRAVAAPGMAGAVGACSFSVSDAQDLARVEGGVDHSAAGARRSDGRAEQRLLDGRVGDRDLRAGHEDPRAHPVEVVPERVGHDSGGVLGSELRDEVVLAGPFGGGGAHRALEHEHTTLEDLAALAGRE